MGYQDVAALARFYHVSTDCLFGLTDNRLHRNVAIDDIALSDGAIDVLKSKRANNRLISELLTHREFPQLIRAMEVYIDRKVLPQMNTMNAMYQLAESALTENCNVTEDDEILSFLEQVVINEDEYLRYRITERFNSMMKNLFDTHKKDVLSDEQSDVVAQMKSDVASYLENRENESHQKAQMMLWAKKLGFNITKLTLEEQQIFMKVLEYSEAYKKNARRKK